MGTYNLFLISLFDSLRVHLDLRELVEKQLVPFFIFLLGTLLGTFLFFQICFNIPYFADLICNEYKLQ